MAAATSPTLGWTTTRLRCQNFFWELRRGPKEPDSPEHLLHARAGRVPAPGLVHQYYGRFQVIMDFIWWQLDAGFDLVHTDDAEIQEQLSGDSPLNHSALLDTSPPDSEFETDPSIMPDEANIHEVETPGDVIVLNGAPVDYMFRGVSSDCANEWSIRFQMIKVLGGKDRGKAVLVEFREGLRGDQEWYKRGGPYATRAEAVTALDKRVRDITGLALTELGAKEPLTPYRLVKQDLAWKAKIGLEEAGTWYFWPESEGSGKEGPWTLLQPRQSRLLESIYMEHTQNDGLHQRFVGVGWKFRKMVNFKRMYMATLLEGSDDDDGDEQADADTANGEEKVPVLVEAIKRVACGEPAPMTEPVWSVDDDGELYQETTAKHDGSMTSP